MAAYWLLPLSVAACFFDKFNWRRSSLYLVIIFRFSWFRYLGRCCLSHFKFRRAFIAQGRNLDELPYRALWYPFGPLIALFMCLIVIIGQKCGMD